jgi:hypothetical protein
MQYAVGTLTQSRENAQRREDMISVNDLGWIAGIADGEGSFFLTLTHCDGVPCIKASFAVENTNELIIKAVKRIVSEIIGKQKRYLPINKKAGYKQAWLFQLTSFEDLKKFSEAVLPYLEGKREQAKTMLEFVNLEVATHGLKRNRGGIQNTDPILFGKRKDLVHRMKWLNQHPGQFYPASSPANDFTGGSHDGMKKKSELHGDMQSTAEMIVPVEVERIPLYS